jgi:hypothetical protein
MATGKDLYVKTDKNAAELAKELYTYDGLTAQEIIELYRRNPLEPNGWDLIYKMAGPPVLTINSLTQEEPVDGIVVCDAETTAGTINYTFQVEVGPGNWFNAQSGPDNSWTDIDPAYEGMHYRCYVVAVDGKFADDGTITGGTLQAAAGTGYTFTVYSNSAGVLTFTCTNRDGNGDNHLWVDEIFSTALFYGTSPTGIGLQGQSSADLVNFLVGSSKPIIDITHQRVTYSFPKSDFVITGSTAVIETGNPSNSAGVDQNISDLINNVSLGSSFTWRDRA